MGQIGKLMKTGHGDEAEAKKRQVESINEVATSAEEGFNKVGRLSICWEGWKVKVPTYCYNNVARETATYVLLFLCVCFVLMSTHDMMRHLRQRTSSCSLFWCLWQWNQAALQTAVKLHSVNRLYV